MRRTAILMVLAMAAGFAAAEDADAILGMWATDAEADAGQAHVEIRSSGDTYEGKIVWLEIPVYEPGDEHGDEGEAKVDTENPDPSLRTRPIVGLPIMWGFQYGGDSKWTKGSIYDPENGKTYRCRIHLTEDGLLKVRGYIGITLLGRTEIWTRVETGDDSG